MKNKKILFSINKIYILFETIKVYKKKEEVFTKTFENITLSDKDTKCFFKEISVICKKYSKFNK